MVHQKDRHAFGATSSRPRNLVDVLRAQSQCFPDRTAYTFLLDGEGETVSWTYSELERRASAIASALVQHGFQPGDRALLIYPPGLDFIAGFFGCLYAGVIAVPLYPPTSSRDFPRLLAVLGDSTPRGILINSPLLTAIQKEAGAALSALPIPWIATDDLQRAPNDEPFQPPIIEGAALAFLQYTSGSTGKPKGVMVSHENILSNETMIAEAFGHDETTTVAGWLPVYHDMGLIGNVLQPLCLGVHCVLMSPQSFLQKPLRWLQMIDLYRATTSGGPNFAYDLCVRKTTSQERAALDLSCWELAFNGAEPIRPETLDRFARAFEVAGFQRQAFYPCYGLAEGTLFVTGGAKHRLPVSTRVSKTNLQRHRLTIADQGDDVELVGCGWTWQAAVIRIVDPETGRLASDGEVGEIWIAGPNVAKGYWNQDTVSKATFSAYTAEGEGPFLRTGDLGAINSNELIVTGRLKDLIILRGRNLYPQDIELVAQAAHAGARPGCGVAFSVDTGEEERLVVLQECRANVDASEHPAMVTAIRAAIARELQQNCQEVVLLKPNTLAKTSSGKLRRSHARAQYLKDGFGGRCFEVPESSLCCTCVEGPASPLDGHVVSPKRHQAAANDNDAVLMRILRSLHGETPRPHEQNHVVYGRETTLSSLGIDSISLVELSTMISTHFCKDLGPKRLMELDSLARIAAELTGTSTSGNYLERSAEEISWNISLASSVRELRSVYSLRYRVYVDEMKLPQAHADHKCRVLSDPLDAQSDILIASDGQGRAIGTLRATGLNLPAARSYLPLLGIEGMPRSRLQFASLSSRLAVDPMYRSTTLAFYLCRAQYRHAKERGILLDYAYCYDEMLPFFLRLGYEHVRDDVRHPEFGRVNIVCLDVQDDESLTRARSPLLFDDLIVRPLSIAS